MPLAKRARRIAAGGLSIALHGALLAAVVTHAPILTIVRESAGPPEPIIPILILPRTPPPVAGGPPGDPIRLHRRSLRPAGPLAPPVQPLETEHPQPTASPRSPGPPPSTTPPLTERSAAVASLWRARLGCSNPDAFGLSRAEREACDRQWAAGARSAPSLGLGLEADKARSLDRAAATQSAARREREGAIASGQAGGSSSQPWKVRP